jgi:Holliday junction resolvase YEN1
VLLTRGGMILIGLMSGGDYQQGGLSRCGTKTAHGLARCGFGDTLYTAAKNLSRERLPAFLDNWRNELRHELRTNSRGLIGRKSPTLANSIPEDFPDIDILLSYVNPITSESMGKRPPELGWTKEPDLAKLAATCEFYFEWGYREAIIKRFRTVIWHSAVLRILRRAVLNMEEAKSTKIIPTTPRKGGERSESGTPSKMIAKHFSSLDIGTDSDDDENEEDTLIVQIHSSRMHASTDGVLEYRLEIAPRQLVEIAESGIKGTRIPEGPDEWVSDEDNEEGSRSSKRVPKPPIDPETHLRVWMPACMVKLAEPHLVREFEEKEEKKKNKKAGKAAGTISRARGKAKATDIDANQQPSQKPTKAKSANKTSKKDHDCPPSTLNSSEDELPASVAQTAPPRTKIKRVKARNAISFDQTRSAPPPSIHSRSIIRDLTQGKKSAVTDMKTFFPTTKQSTLHAPSKKIKDLFAESSSPSTIDGERQTFKSSKPAPFPAAFINLNNISECSSNSILPHSRGALYLGDLQDLSIFSPRKLKKCAASDSDSDPPQRITKSPRKSSAHTSPSSKNSHGRRAERPPSPTPVNSVARVLSNEVIELSSDSDCEPPPFQIMPTRKLPPLIAARAKATAKARLPKMPTASVAGGKAKSIVGDIIDLT